MRFTDLFIRRPVLAVVVSLILLLLGLRAYEQLELREYPEVSYPVITVKTAYPGASAGLVKGFITTPLQHAIASVGGIDYLTSTSDEGISTVKAYLQPGADIDAALVQITAKVQKARGDLPRDAENPLVERETSMQSETLQYLAYSSDDLTPEQITDYLAKVVQPKISTLHGIARADLEGKKTYAMRIWLDPQRMAAFHVSAAEVRQAVEKNNFQTAAGQTRGRYVLFNVIADTGLESPKEFRRIVVKSDHGTLVRIGDLGRVELGAEEYHTALRYGDKNVVFVRTVAAADANPLSAARVVRNALPKIAAQLPDGIKQELVFDSTYGIQHSIDEVVKTLIEAALIVIIVIFLFLGSLRSVLIPVVTIPLSLVGVLSAMLAMGFSVNLLTLLAMVLAIGLVVDDAIVVVENIQRHIEEGARPLKAALEGAREIAFPVIAMTITLAAVYAPIGFLGGLTGVLFTQFAFTLAGAVIVSGIIALTLSPMMCSYMLKSEDIDHGLVHWLDDRFERLKAFYRRALGAALVNRAQVFLVGAAVLVSIPFLYLSIHQELAPSEDNGAVSVAGRGPMYANLDYTKRYTDQVQKIIQKVPEVQQSFTMQGAFGPNSMFSMLMLKPWSERDRSSKQIQQELSKRLSKVAGLQMYSFLMPTIPGISSDLPVQLVVTTTGSDQLLYQVSEKVADTMRKSGLFMFVDPKLRYDKPVAEVKINRDLASEMGVSMQDIGQTLSVFLGENNTGRFAVNNYSYKVILQAGQADRLRPEDLDDYYVKTRNGTSVPLSTFVNIRIESRPNQLRQFQQQNAAFIGAEPAPGVTMGQAIKWLDATTARELPTGFSHDYFGESRQFLEEGGKLVWTFGFSFVLIYLVLAAQFESFRDPLIVLVSVPMSLFGALVPLALGAATLNIYTQIGLVTLIGLISKHGILIVDFANRLQHDSGLGVREAVIEAAATRLRPILMTTAAMVFGVLPLLFATGAGANSRYCIGVVITTGIAVGTCFTLFVVPAFYTLFAPRHQRSSRERELDALQD